MQIDESWQQHLPLRVQGLDGTIRGKNRRLAKPYGMDQAILCQQPAEQSRMIGSKEARVVNKQTWHGGFHKFLNNSGSLDTPSQRMLQATRPPELFISFLPERSGLCARIHTPRESPLRLASHPRRLRAADGSREWPRQTH